MPEDSTSVALNAISRFMTLLKIKYLVYIDDKNDIEHEKGYFIGALKAAYVVRNEQLQKQLSQIQWNLPTAPFHQYIEALWDSLTEEKKKKYLSELKNEEGKVDDIENSKLVYNFPLNLPKEMIEQIAFTPNQWQERKAELLKILTDDKKMLCLFDIEFEGCTFDGVELAKDILTGEHAEKIYCGLFSHTFSIEDENKKRKEISERGIEFKRFYTISKKRHSEEGMAGLAEGMRNALTVTAIEDLKTKSIDIIKESFDNTSKYLSDMSPEIFNHIVQKSSEKEGVWEIDTFFRLTNILLDKRFKECISDGKQRSKFTANISNIREFEKIETGAKTQFNKKEIKSIRKDELYYGSALINKLHYPLANGDIFKINDKRYILLVQPCNLSIRSNGKRTPELIAGMIVPLQKNELQKNTPIDDNTEKSEYDKLKSEYDKLKSEYDELKKAYKKLKVRAFLDDTQEYFLYFPSYVTIDLNYLDLCVFNADGCSKIDLDLDKIPCEEFLQDSLKKHYKETKKGFLKLEKCYDAFDSINKELSISNDIKDVIKNIKPQLSLYNCVKGISQKPYTQSKRCFDFGISRTKRLKSPYSDDLLHQFMLYLSRAGFEHDFSVTEDL